MAKDRLLALVGTGQGPLLRTRGIERPRLRVSGLQAGETVHVETDQHVFSFNEDGLHELHETDWVQVRAEVKKAVVCTIHGGRRDALHSTQ